MKKGYLQLGVLLLLVHFNWKRQLAMARHSHHRRTFSFNECYRCPPGYGVERHCNRHHDTECVACSPDHYSSHHSARRPCYPCSRCGIGLYVAHRCTASKDTVCDSCHTYKGPHNEDFYERCIKPFEAARNATRRQEHATKESPSFVRVDETKALPTSVVIVSGIAIGALAVTLVVTCFAVWSRRHCKRAGQRYPYEAVATQEAVML